MKAGLFVFLPRFPRTLSRWAAGMLAWAALLLIAISPLRAQGVLTATPGRSLVTSAGTGSVGFSGDGAAASAAQLARPAGIAYDASGNLFLADANNHVIREITPSGIITTVAGTGGVAGYAGDGGVATSALLDTPTGVAVDGSGNFYIADSHNHAIREVSSGRITTIAGNGRAGYSGDGGPAISSQLALPNGVAVDSSGSLYIADTNNQRVRKIAGGRVSTIAGNGEELFAGDGGLATAASLDQPTGLALDAAGNLFIADKNNQRIRVVNSSGMISTLAGSGAVNLAGGFGGDGGSATAAALARPVAVAVDSSGNVFVADTNNQRIRQVSTSGAIATVAGTGDQGFGGDGSLAVTAILNSPRGVSTDSSGNLLIADTRNQRLRAASQGQISFRSQAVGTISAPQSITLSNTGTGPLTVTSAVSTGPFAFTPGGTCPAVPIGLAAGASCTEEVAYLPVAASSASGSAVFSGANVNTQKVMLAGGVAAQGITTLALTESKTSSLSGETVTFTAALSAPAFGAAPAGSVTFYDGATVLGTSPLVNGVANLSTTLPDGTQTITAAYPGSANFFGSSSTAVSENVADYTLGLSAPATPTVQPGHSIVVPVTLAANGVTGLTANVQLVAGALPAGLSSVSFSPASAALVDGQLAFTMNVTAAPVGQIAVNGTPSLSAGGAVLALLLLPVFGRRRRQTARGMRPLLLAFISVSSGVLLAGLSGCSGSTGFFGQAQKSYTVNVTATAADSTGGTLRRSTFVTIDVQ